MLFIAPVSNDQSDHITDLRRRVLIRAVIVNMPVLNLAVAIDLCKNFNLVLKCKKFTFRAGKCEKQKGQFSCGKHVVLFLNVNK